MRDVLKQFGVAAALVLLPSLAYAQGTLTGTVRDASGAGATLRSQPPLQLTANWLVPNTVVQSLLGRLPPGGTATGTTTVALIDPLNPNATAARWDHRHYADNRRTQIDMPVAKIVRLNLTVNF